MAFLLGLFVLFHVNVAKESVMVAQNNLLVSQHWAASVNLNVCVFNLHHFEISYAAV